MGGCPLHLAVCSGGASTQLFLKMTASRSDERQNASIRDVLEGAGLGRWSTSRAHPSRWPRGHTGKWSQTDLPTDDVWFRRAARRVSPGRQEPTSVRRGGLSAPRLPSQPIGSDSAGSQPRPESLAPLPPHPGFSSRAGKAAYSWRCKSSIPGSNFFSLAFTGTTSRVRPLGLEAWFYLL